MTTASHDPDAGVEPAYAAPAHACDAHFHVFGAAERYPYGADLRYQPPHAPLKSRPISAGFQEVLAQPAFPPSGARAGCPLVMTPARGWPNL